MIKTSLLTLGLLTASVLSAASGNLEIYWIDAEGGAATLIVAPTGESVLVDTANRRDDDRDANRILAATKAAGLSKIDILVTTHYHGDHIGAMPALAKLIPIEHYMDHGPSVELDRPRVAALYKAYEDLSAGKRTMLKAGDKIPLGALDITVVQSAGESITSPLPGGGAANPTCSSFEPIAADTDPDNDQSVGFVLRFCDFTFLDLGDLTWNYEKGLVCPANMLGKIDLYQTTHHGLDRSNSPQILAVIEPVVAVFNNGARKGGPAAVFENLRATPRLEDIWQGHFATRTPKEINTAEQMIANLGDGADCEGNLLKAVVLPDGKFTLTNMRNGFSKSYQSK
ncbi:MAG: MBL fold metallo-hydrolase [Acidobacteria bacterium]|nr:MBL fold metallo-hydrolase [Acidobacteriota bacterium]MDA1236530.1 MBL fold metallo-hydrolase [Acidobacteriota bacterium]